MKFLFRWGNIILFIAMIIINSLANIIPINGNTTGDVSSKYTNLFTPAPYTFSIWGVIYLFMGFFCIYSVIASPENDNISTMRHSVGFLFILSCLFNIAWIFAWHYEKIGLSVMCILGLLVTLIIINIRFTITPHISVPLRICVYGFNVYLGWICAATIANISVFLTKINWTRFGLSPTIWTVILLLVVGVIGLAFIFFGGRFMATLSLLWAIIGIMANYLNRNIYGSAYPLITLTISCIAVILLLCLIFYPISLLLSFGYKNSPDNIKP